MHHNPISPAYQINLIPSVIDRSNFGTIGRREDRQIEVESPPRKRCELARSRSFVIS